MNPFPPCLGAAFRLLLGLVVCCFAAKAQTGVVTGVVTDAKTKQPMPLAVVFIANTTIGTTADENGKYTLYNVPMGTVEIVASFVGYANTRQRIEVTGKMELNLALQPQDRELTEVKVVAKYGKDWAKNLRRFREAFIGFSGNAAGCHILNPEVLHFDYDKESDKLKATAAEPLEIENRSLGYKITFYLEKFETANSLTVYYGVPKFEPLKTTQKRMQVRWRRNRQTTYRGSLYHFLRSLVYQNWEQEGFLAYHDIRKVPSNRFYDLVGQRLIPIQVAELIRPSRNPAEREFAFNGKLEIIYTRKRAEPPLRYKDINYQSSTIEMNVPAFDIHVDGWATGILPLKISGDLSNYRIADLLPFDYLPEGANRNLPASAALPTANVLGNAAMDSLLVHYNQDAFFRNQQKLYLHPDKPYYRSADEVWFKAYLTDLAGVPVADKNEIITVELLSANNRLIDQIQLQTNTHWAAGSFTLPDTLSTGMYRLRAYTQHMRNFDPGYFFDQPLEIYNVYPIVQTPSAAEATPLRKRRKDKEPVPTSASPILIADTVDGHTLDMQFFPEGGDWIENQSGRIAFKAIGRDGRSRKVQGVVKDNQDNLITNFESNALGMGHFFIKPEPGRTYRVLLDSNSSQSFALPAPLKSGISMKLDNVHFGDDIYLYIRATPDYLQQPFYIVVQSHGQIYYVGKGLFDHELVAFKIPKARFPGGVCQLTLFNEQAVPVCERLFFSQPQSIPLTIRITPAKPHHTFREKVRVELEVTDTTGVPQEASLSLAITDASQTETNQQPMQIPSYLLLASDLRGYVENPDFYFKDNAEPTLEALDNLLMTQGWRRFTWMDFKKDSVPPPIANEGFELSGTLLDPLDARKALAGHGLLFISQDSLAKGFIQTTTDAAGRFSISHLRFEDSLKVMVQVLNPKGQQVRGTIRWATTLLDSTLRHFTARRWLSPQHADSVIRTYQQNATFMKAERPMRTQFLKEVVVKAQAVKPEDDAYRGAVKLYDAPDGTIEVDANSGSLGTIYDILRGRLSGVQVTGPDASGGYHVTIRGASSFGSSEPLFLLDGVPIGANSDSGVDLSFINPRDVARIDVVKNSGASMYGARGGNGIIAIYTRKSSRSREAKTLEPLFLWLKGLQAPRQFYQPNYDVPAADKPKTDVRATLYWNPNLKLDEEGKATIDFYNSDMATKWRCVLEGITLYGQPLIHSVVLENGNK